MPESKEWVTLVRMIRDLPAVPPGLMRKLEDEADEAIKKLLTDEVEHA